MKYQSGAAFRRALEDRLRLQSLQSGIPLVRMRKMIAFDRFLARLLYNQPDHWVIKGGFALQLRPPDLLAFAGLPPTVVPCYPITQQIAEKLHACTRTFQSGESTRVKDYVDILLLAGMGEIDGNRLCEAISSTFNARNTHPLPLQLPTLPKHWLRPFQRIAHEVKLEHASLEEADKAMKTFLNPVLSGEAIDLWDPLHWDWQRR